MLPITKVIAGTLFLGYAVASLPSNEVVEIIPDISENRRNVYSIDSTLAGRTLALKYCRSCHLFPEPELLDKKTWISSTLPNMALRLGIREAGKNPFEALTKEEEVLVRSLDVYPEQPLISRNEWDKIVQYYQEEAPQDPLPPKTRIAVTNELPQFKAELIAMGEKPLPQTTLLKFDKASSQLYVGDAQNTLYVLDSTLQLTNTWWIDSAPSDIDFPKAAAPRLLTMGIFSPSDQKLGRLMSLDKSPQPGSINIKSLPRPVQFAAADLNLDGKEDIVFCGFGNHSGKLFWYDGGDPEKEHVLKALPGARRVEIRDFNNDRKPDIMVLMAQAQEQVIIFYNLGNGNFKEKQVLSFPPVYGVSYFELVDFNKDGYMDILLTNGDNWDYSPTRKNYHGVRLYLNDRKDNFKEAWFYPLYGASKALARDFDGDGDIDIAAISFYDDLERPEQSFVLLTNEGKLNFKAYSTPEAASGKWLTMEAGDFDGDGDMDIVLGSYYHTVGELSKLIYQGVMSFPQLLILSNQKK